MPGAEDGNLTDGLWITCAQRGELESLLRAFLEKYAIAVERFDYSGGTTECVVRGPLSHLENLSIAVVAEKLRDWLPSTVEFQIRVLAA